MKLAKLVGERFKERPVESVADSHALMLRGGYMKIMANGIYASYLPLKRVTQKIENIIREEMDQLDGQEVSMPVVLPASFWEKSGRYETVGSELLRFQDRHENPYVLAMTHEEAAVMLVKDYAQSYIKYPFMIYQIQTKFRDEARPRAGLIRVREFTMKDAYSFHTSQNDLETYYGRCLKAYHRIFNRVGLPEVIDVASDSGMMGGSISHEFMLLNEIGEDSIAVCEKCGYHANVEAAPSIIKNSKRDHKELHLVSTPNIETIDDLASFFEVGKEKILKSVVYQKIQTNEAVIVFIRGDLEVNESKLTNYLGYEIEPANGDTLIQNNLVVGFIGPKNLETYATIVYDFSLKDACDFVCGANQKDYHYRGFDVEVKEFIDVAKIKNDGICPCCGKPTIQIKRGIEVGNIFQLGDKYTKSMEMTYINQEGKKEYPIMGCYGIGVGRLAASLVEARHDENGPIWPISVAPWQVHLCALRIDDINVKEKADALYETLLENRFEVIYDDRKVSAGMMFSEADLLGVPVRVVISPRTLKDNSIEISLRDHTFKEVFPLDKAIKTIQDLIIKLSKKL